MANLRDIKRRITSVQSTQKITSAMKMVAAAKLRRQPRQQRCAKRDPDHAKRQLRQPVSGYRFGTDAVFLAASVPAGQGRLLDMGAGAGAVALGVSWRLPDYQITAVEKDPVLAKLLASNIQANGRAGNIRALEADITSLPPQHRVQRGMGFVPQTQNVFTSMTVEENLEMGGFIRGDDFRDTIEEIYNLFPVLREKRAQPAGELSGGQRQQVAVGRALMTQPKVLMLDEPTAGVSPIVMDELFDRIIDVARTGIAILMVEQNAKQALAIADRGYVLVQGENRYTDSGAALLANPDVRRAFLGG